MVSQRPVEAQLWRSEYGRAQQRVPSDRHAAAAPGVYGAARDRLEWRSPSRGLNIQLVQLANRQAACTVRSRYRRQLIRLNMKKKWPTRTGMEDTRPIFFCKLFSYNENALYSLAFRTGCSQSVVMHTYT